MTIAIESQVAAFLWALLVGAALGLFYDLLRPFRLEAPQWKEWALDFFFWIVVTLTVFVSAPLLENGQIRIYMLLANVLGALGYFKLLSRPVRAVSGRLLALWRRCKALVLRPFRWIFSILSAPLFQFFYFVRNGCKKLFLFPVKWFRIRRIPKEAGATGAAAMATSSEEGHWHEGQHVYLQKGWSSFEDRSGDSAALHPLYDGAHAGADRRSQ